MTDSRVAAVTIERLRSGDHERLRAIRLRALRDSPDAFATTFADAERWTPEQWVNQVASVATFVAVLDGHDVGLVRGAPSSDDSTAAYLISMWVAPTVRRSRVGAHLIEAVVRWAATEGFQKLLLDVSEGNAPAIGLYSSKGFRRTGKTGTLPPPRQHIAEFQMELELHLGYDA